MLLYFISCFELLLKKHIFNEKFSKENAVQMWFFKTIISFVDDFFFHGTHLQWNKTVIKTLNSLNITVPLVTSRDPSNVIMEKRSYQKCNVLRQKAFDFSNLEL